MFSVAPGWCETDQTGERQSGLRFPGTDIRLRQSQGDWLLGLDSHAVFLGCPAEEEGLVFRDHAELLDCPSGRPKLTLIIPLSAFDPSKPAASMHLPRTSV